MWLFLCFRVAVCLLLGCCLLASPVLFTVSVRWAAASWSLPCPVSLAVSAGLLPVGLFCALYMEDMFSSLIDLTVADLRDPCTAFLVEGPSVTSNETSASIVLHGFDLDFSRSISENVWLTSNQMESDAKDLACSQFFSNNKSLSFSSLRENADVIWITMLSNRSRNVSKSVAPVAEYFPEAASCVFANFKLDVLCYSSKECPIASVISKLVVPGLIDQLLTMKNVISPSLSARHSQDNEATTQVYKRKKQSEIGASKKFKGDKGKNIIDEEEFEDDFDINYEDSSEDNQSDDEPALGLNPKGMFYF
ncbi:hypothetical protein M5K25_003729 [Dendrobium thyrsiflorum]|uniref:Uncharacterized protein n=1 Tax=Dendrobium thyrsiflorum TaxID=117978 RepID=A0ABD0VJT2_DENTH